MEHTHPTSATCPIYRLCEALSKKWIMHILRSLTTGGKMRFSALLTSMPEINSRMLSERLSELEQAGLVKREVQDSKPIVISYELTEKGRDLQKIFHVFVTWEKKWGDERMKT